MSLFYKGSNEIEGGGKHEELQGGNRTSGP